MRERLNQRLANLYWPLSWPVSLLCMLSTLAQAEEPAPERTLQTYLVAASRADETSLEAVVSQRARRAWPSRERLRCHPLAAPARRYEFQIGSPAVDGNVARVPTLLSMSDKFLRHPTTEDFEIFTLVRERGAWKVDAYRTLSKPDEIERWFPGHSRRGTFCPLLRWFRVLVVDDDGRSVCEG